MPAGATPPGTPPTPARAVATRHVVAATDEIPPGGRKLVAIGGRDILVFNLAGEFFAIANRCPHNGGSLCAGRTTGLVQSSEPGRYHYSRQGEIIRCPWHNWEFDIRTGRSVIDPRRIKVRAFPAEVASGAALQAETFPVQVEGEYVVVEA
ncbi:Rieske (2Fe-2S) protein [Roseomonas sp. NAR14]|uniref:Rieske (2Fe-2S) protein n=1 Tax=Roseomonas acroporae TaxID=2937791 RepID=A0A9X1YCS4_9PROT|nr:Rieske (2Fe-2S) protein [Roseomonas acroporae]MCK8786332.1 Rieske (2Fe-2S) protein [Roseomonas acroporae]